MTILDFDALASIPAYAGYDAFAARAPWVVAAPGPLRQQHKERFWFLDFHWPRGLTPMGTVYLHDCYAWAAQLAASQLPLATSNGLGPMLAGTHVYSTQLDVSSLQEAEIRAERASDNIAHYVENFADIWKQRVAELQRGLARFENANFEDMAPADLADWAVAARAFQRRAWEIHFEIMYPLLANYLGFRSFCEKAAVDLSLLPLFFQGYDNKIMQCDRELWRLAAAARAAGIDTIFAGNAPEDLLASLRRAPAAGGWLDDFDAFLQTYGWRTEGIADVYLAPWIEEPMPALGTIKTLLAAGSDRDFDANLADVVAEREAAIRLARASVADHDRETFDRLLASCTTANFNWWNDEHNFYIDLRASIPLRRVFLALGRALDCTEPDDTLFLFFDEAVALARGSGTWDEWRETVAARRAFYLEWQRRRDELPPVVGTVPDRVDDPILIEIFGLHHRYLASLRDVPSTGTLSGLGVSKGVARGRAVVHRNSDDLHRLEQGDILVCEATSPNWNPAFGKIAACVCDVGGALTHAAIVAREYRIPCVVGVGVATRQIRTGDLIEVDGTLGSVRILPAG